MAGLGCDHVELSPRPDFLSWWTRPKVNPERGRAFRRALEDHGVGLYASAEHLLSDPAPPRRDDLARHAIVGYVEELAGSAALDDGMELCVAVPVRSQCASAVGQLEAVRAGIGIGAIQASIARRHPELVRVPPESGARRPYRLVEHEDTRVVGRIRAVHDFIVAAVDQDRAEFARWA